MKRTYVASSQKGTKGHCFAAQVFKNGKAFIMVEPTDDEREATKTAKTIAYLMNRHEQGVKTVRK